MDTFTTLWNRLLLRAPVVGASLAQDLIKDAFNQLAEKRQWSWLRKHSTFYPPVYTITGTVSVAANGLIVTGVGTQFIPKMVGSQFQLGGPSGASYPTYTISQYISPTSIVLDSPWIGPSLSTQGYSIFQCYFSVPTDFNYFHVLVNPTLQIKLNTRLTQSQLAINDPQRNVTGYSLGAAFYDYTASFSGTVDSTLQVKGSGPVPISTTSYGYNYPVDSIYVIEITTGGAVGVAVFQWKQDDGAYTTGITTSSDALDLTNNVQVYFPLATYTAGDVFIIKCSADNQPSVPRYELWPRPINAQYTYPYIYIARIPTLSNDKPQLPDFIANRGDVILSMALAQCCRFPGTDTMRNGLYDLNLAAQYDAISQRLINELEMKDDDVAPQDLITSRYSDAIIPWMDGDFARNHDVNYYGGY